MPLSLPVLARIQAETPTVMLQAAEARLREAETLLENGRWDGAVYLAGYVAEMLLKVAFCNLDPTFPINGTVDSVFGPARVLWQSLAPGQPLPFQHKHSLQFWEQALEPHRRASGISPMEWGDALLMSKHLNTIRLHWQVDLRYQAPLAAPEEARTVCFAARWLFDNRHSLGVRN